MNKDPRLKPGYLGNQNNARYPLPPSIPTETVCLRVDIPKSLYWYTVFWNQLFALGKWTAYDYDTNKTATVVANQMLQLLWDAKQQMPRWDMDSALCEDCEPCNDCPPVSSGGGQSLPECITISPDGKTIDIDLRICEDMTINIYQSGGCGCGCGCGCGGNGNKINDFSGGKSSGGGSSGAWTYDGNDGGEQAVQYGISQCDFITTVIPAIMQSAAEFVQYIDDNAENFDNLIDGLSTLGSIIPLVGNVGGSASQWITTVINTSSSAVLAMVEDQDFIYKVMEAWVKTYGQQSQRMETVTRQQLLQIVQYLPNTWLGAGVLIFPKLIMDGIFRVLNMNKVASRFILATDSANDSLCQYIYAGAGQIYEATPEQDAYDLPFPSEGEILSEGFDWAMSFDLRDAPFEINSYFNFRQDSGSDVGLYELGVGYKVKPDVLEEPHAATRLTMDFTQGSGGDVQKSWVEYQYEPLLEESTSRLQDIFDTSFDKDTAWNGVRIQTDMGWTSGQREITLRPYRVLNSTSANGGIGIVSRIALAGTGTNPLSGLVQTST